MTALAAAVARAGGPKPRPARETDVASLEASLGVPLPDDYRLWLRSAGGERRGPGWRGLWHVGEVLSLDRNLAVFRWYGGIVGIGSGGFLVRALDDRRGARPTVVTVGLGSSEPEVVRDEAPSFDAWLEGPLPSR